jgi:hypothetical protein
LSCNCIAIHLTPLRWIDDSTNWKDSLTWCEHWAYWEPLTSRQTPFLEIAYSDLLLENDDLLSQFPTFFSFSFEQLDVIPLNLCASNSYFLTCLMDLISGMKLHSHFVQYAPTASKVLYFFFFWIFISELAWHKANFLASSSATSQKPHFHDSSPFFSSSSFFF